MKLLCGDDDDRLVAYFPSCSNSIPGENGNFLHWKFSKGANKNQQFNFLCWRRRKKWSGSGPAAKVIPTPYLHVFRPQNIYELDQTACLPCCCLVTNGPEAACSKSYSYTSTTYMCSDHRPICLRLGSVCTVLSS
jgi:hypothetical protein